MQSRALVWSAGTALAVLCVRCARSLSWEGFFLEALGVSLTFGVLVWGLRAATASASFCGGMICLLDVVGTRGEEGSLVRSGLTPLVVLFALTFCATRAGRGRKRAAGLAEGPRGRRASQVIANLGCAGLLGGWLAWDLRGRMGLQAWSHAGIDRSLLPVLLLSALAEATADTVSSEIGQAYGGTPRMLTTLRPVAAGTDGAVSLLGTGAGIAGAGAVAMAGMWAMRLTWAAGIACFAGGVAGLFIDSALGATVERRGWLGNDLVNFLSTVFGGMVGLLAMLAC